MGTKQKKNNSFLIQGAILASASIITKMIGIIYRVPLTNILGKEGQGIYGYVYEIYAIALLLTSYSLPLAVSKLVSLRIAKGEKRNAYRVFKAAMLFAVVVGSMISLVIFLGADFISVHIMTSEFYALPLKVLAPALFIVAVVSVIRGYFQGLGTMLPTAISQILEQIINAIVSIVGASYLLNTVVKAAEATDQELLASSHGAAGGTLGTVIGALTALLFLLFVFAVYKRVINRQIRRDRTRVTESYSDIFKILLLTIAPVIMSTAVYNISQVLDQTIFSKIMDIQGHKEKEYIAMLGMFGIYNTLINVPLAVANALGASVIPSLSEAVATGERKVIHHKMQLTIRFAMLIAIPSFVGYLALAQPILDLLYGGDNTKIALMLRIGAITVVFYCLSTVTNAMLQGINRMTAPVKNAGISLIIHLISLFIMLVMFKWNIFAVVASNIVFSLSMCILNAKELRRASGYHQEVRKTFVLPGIAATIMGVVAFLAYLLFNLFLSGKLATLIALLIAGITYGISLILLGGISEEELLSAPKGATLVTLLRRMHLLKEEYH